MVILFQILIKQNIKRDLRRYSVAGIVPEILDLKYLFIETNSKVYYNTNLAPSASFVSTKVQRDLTAYAESSELNKYGARFKYSRFLKVIDSSHESVTSNITTVEMRRDLRLPHLRLQNMQLTLEMSFIFNL